jgi:CheY-like chemotaxis protein
VFDAGSAEEALQQLAQMPSLDLLFTDIRLPGMDGWSLATKVRALHANAPVIYASGNAELQELLPRSEFIQKPYRSEHIFRVAADLGVDLPRTALE